MKTELSQGNEGTVIKISGPIDEDAVFPAASGAKVTLDLQGVTLINSCGIREWMNWLKHLDKNSKIELRHCPKVIVDQINNVDGFLPKGGAVESFLVPYYCENCGILSSKQYLTADVVKKGASAIDKTYACDKCKAQVEMDVIPSKYFLFLSA